MHIFQASRESEAVLWTGGVIFQHCCKQQKSFFKLFQHKFSHRHQCVHVTSRRQKKSKSLLQRQQLLEKEVCWTTSFILLFTAETIIQGQSTLFARYFPHLWHRKRRLGNSSFKSVFYSNSGKNIYRTDKHVYSWEQNQVFLKLEYIPHLPSPSRRNMWWIFWKWI